MGKKKKEKPCEHETYVIAFWIDHPSDEAWLLQTCDLCGKNFLLLGETDFTLV